LDGLSSAGIRDIALPAGSLKVAGGKTELPTNFRISNAREGISDRSDSVISVTIELEPSE
jgi:hypothetical protein